MKFLDNAQSYNALNATDGLSANAYVGFGDKDTDYVYISDKLKVFYPGTYRRLIRLFDKMSIGWGEIAGTKDIWVRDFMPVQLTRNRFLVYDYCPDYLTGSDRDYLTDSQTIARGVVPERICRHTKIRLDGGNVVVCGSSMILTDKVFADNGREKYDSEFVQHLRDALLSDVVIIPWHCSAPEDVLADVYGHADGFVKWTGGRNLLMSNHRETDSAEALAIRSRLEENGFAVTEMLFDVAHPSSDFNWAYINYLEVGRKIIVPVFGIPEDSQALKYISDANPGSIIATFRMRDIASCGGALHCITWNIKKSWL